jgi:hypothetical protein
VRVAATLSVARSIALAAVVALGGAGCAHVPAQEAHAPNVITADQIEASQSVTAYEAIQKLQPNFLVARGPTSLSGTSSAFPNVWLDDVPYGPLATLKDIPAQNVALIRMYRAWEATYKFGTGNMGGVIEVFTKH